MKNIFRPLLFITSAVLAYGQANCVKLELRQEGAADIVASTFNPTVTERRTISVYAFLENGQSGEIHVSFNYFDLNNKVWPLLRPMLSTKKLRPGWNKLFELNSDASPTVLPAGLYELVPAIAVNPTFINCKVPDSVKFRVIQ